MCDWKGEVTQSMLYIKYMYNSLYICTYYVYKDMLLFEKKYKATAMSVNTLKIDCSYVKQNNLISCDFLWRCYSYGSFLCGLLTQLHWQ